MLAGGRTCLPIGNRPPLGCFGLGIFPRSLDERAVDKGRVGVEAIEPGVQDALTARQRYCADSMSVSVRCFPPFWGDAPGGFRSRR